MKKEQVEELLYQALETELGGVEVYRSAIACAQNDDLKKEWKKYGSQTQEHVQVLLGVFETLGLDPEKQTTGRRIVHDKAQGLVAAMEKAMREGSLAAAQLVAAECVVDAETKDHMNWELIGEIAKKAPANAKKALTEAYDQVEDEEDDTCTTRRAGRGSSGSTPSGFLPSCLRRRKSRTSRPRWRRPESPPSARAKTRRPGDRRRARPGGRVTAGERPARRAPRRFGGGDGRQVTADR